MLALWIGVNKSLEGLGAVFLLGGRGPSLPTDEECLATTTIAGFEIGP